LTERNLNPNPESDPITLPKSKLVLDNYPDKKQFSYRWDFVLTGVLEILNV